MQTLGGRAVRNESKVLHLGKVTKWENTLSVVTTRRKERLQNLRERNDNPTEDQYMDNNGVAYSHGMTCTVHESFEFYIPAAAGLQLHFLIRTANDTWNCNSYHPGSVLGSVSSNNKREQNPYKNTDKTAAGKLIGMKFKHINLLL
ncbi:unnamed protein product [Caretta caretta]